MKKVIIGVAVLVALVSCKARETHYDSCAEAKAHNAAPLYKGDSGYSTKLDRNGDGVACEK